MAEVSLHPRRADVCPVTEATPSSHGRWVALQSSGIHEIGANQGGRRRPAGDPRHARLRRLGAARALAVRAPVHAPRPGRKERSAALVPSGRDDPPRRDTRLVGHVRGRGARCRGHDRRPDLASHPQRLPVERGRRLPMPGRRRPQDRRGAMPRRLRPGPLSRRAPVLRRIGAARSPRLPCRRDRDESRRGALRGTPGGRKVLAAREVRGSRAHDTLRRHGGGGAGRRPPRCVARLSTPALGRGRPRSIGLVGQGAGRDLPGGQIRGSRGGVVPGRFPADTRVLRAANPRPGRRRSGAGAGGRRVPADVCPDVPQVARAPPRSSGRGSSASRRRWRGACRSRT